jgi:hypothetical protein
MEKNDRRFNRRKQRTQRENETQEKAARKVNVCRAGGRE